MNIFFWNINNKIDCFNLVKEFLSQQSECIFVVSEFWDIADDISLPKDIRFTHDDINKRIGVLHKNNFNVEYRTSKEYYLITSLIFNSIEIIICSVHLKSRLRGEEVQQRIINHTIEEIKIDLSKFDSKHKIIIGDFNVDPHDDSLINIFKFNSVSSLKHRVKKHKTYKKTDYDIYYNPFFSYQGDLSKGPPGTFFYEKETQTHSWYIFDQALINSSLINNVNTEECAILENLNGINLCASNGIPDSQYSDHLPIKIKIK